MRLSATIFTEYCRNVKEIGSVLPDSKACVNSLLRFVPFETANVIVEFGSASGAVTREIMKRKRPDTFFLAFEKNRSLHAALTGSLAGEKFFLLNEDAYNCGKVLEGVLGCKGKTVDCIVSTLPCSCLDFNVLMRRSVLPVLKDRGRFVQYTHTVSRIKGFYLDRLLDKYFKNVVSDYVLLNIPPVLVYTCSTLSACPEPAASPAFVIGDAVPGDGIPTGLPGNALAGRAKMTTR